LGGDSNDKKSKNIIHLALDGGLFSTQQPTKKSGSGIGRFEEVTGPSESVGAVQINRFGGNRVGRVLKTKIKSPSLQINFFLSPMISVS
jgi:hypothetical protein